MAGDRSEQPFEGARELEQSCLAPRQRNAPYLEIELPLSDDWKLKRQIFLARKDRFVLLADAFIGPVAAAVEIRCAQAVPLEADVSFVPQRESRDGHLVAAQRRRAVVVPPALAEWRAEFCHAELAVANGHLTLHQASLGRAAYAPLWIDLDSRRALRPLTWRRLTIGENLATVPRDAAAAYRIQAGSQQWLLYRSLAPQGNRSVLGYNTFAKFACARILTGAKTEDILTMSDNLRGLANEQRHVGDCRANRQPNHVRVLAIGGIASCNSAVNGGISRKIQSPSHIKAMKDVPGLIISRSRLSNLPLIAT